MNGGNSNSERIFGRLQKLYALVDSESFPRHALETIKGLIPAHIHSWINIATEKKTLGEAVTLEPVLTRLDAVRRVAGKIAMEHPCLAKVMSQKEGHLVLRLSELVDFKKWQEHEIYKEIHQPNNIRDQLMVACRGAKYHFTFALSRDSVFTENDCEMARALTGHVEQAWKNAAQFSLSHHLSHHGNERYALNLPRNLESLQWPQEVVQALQRHSSAPVLTFRQPLPEDFLIWLTGLHKALHSVGAKIQKPQSYVSANSESRLTARLILGTGVLGACVVIEVMANDSYADRLAQHGLSPRECEVAQWMAQGKRNDDIGKIIGCETSTVRKHVQAIFEKLGVESRAAVIAMLLEK